MAMPKAAGGKGDGQNPEQLFALGYSGTFCVCFSQLLRELTIFAACFLGALQLQASRAGKKEAAEVAKVSAKVFLGHPEDANVDGFGIRVEIIVENFDDDAVIAAAHEVSSEFYYDLHLSNVIHSFAHTAVHLHMAWTSRSSRPRHTRHIYPLCFRTVLYCTHDINRNVFLCNPLVSHESTLTRSRCHSVISEYESERIEFPRRFDV